MLTTKRLPVAAFTVAYGESARQEALTCAASFRHWHPDIPFFCIDEAGYRLLSGGLAPAWLSEVVSMRSLAGWFLSKHIDRLIYLDSDLFVLERLEHLVNPKIYTALTLDCAAYTMGVPECPHLNSGVLASSDPNFWSSWTAAQFGCLVPGLDNFYFNQLSLRLLALNGCLRTEVIDGRAGEPFYNISLRDYPGEWRVENNRVYKGDEQALIFHQAGETQRGIAAAPPALRRHLHHLTRCVEVAPSCLKFADLWQESGLEFIALLSELIPRWPTHTLDGVLASAYARAPGHYRTVTPTYWDCCRNLKGTSWRRMWNHPWGAYLYVQGTMSGE